jgi:hypothetical protein
VIRSEGRAARRVLRGALCAFAFVHAGLSAETSVYREWSESSPESAYEKSIDVTPADDGFRMATSAPAERAEYLLDDCYSIISMRLTRTDGGADIFAERRGDRIHVTGILAGKSVREDVKIPDGAIWQQEWMPFAAFASVRGIGAAKILSLNFSGSVREGLFALERLSDSAASVQDATAVSGWASDASRFRIVLAGLPGRLIHMESIVWVRESDGVAIRCAMPTGINGPLLISELVRREE